MVYGLRYYWTQGIIRDSSILPKEGAWLKFYDPEAHDGQGLVEWTEDPAQALRFSDQRAAWECYRRVPVRRPYRPDGKPNRPLTACTIGIEPLPEFAQ